MADKKLTDQWIESADVDMPDFVKSPWTPHFKTNNFIQHVFGLNFIYDPDEERWYVQKGSKDGKSFVNTTAFDHELELVTAISNEVVSGATAITHDSVDVSKYNRMMFLFAATGSLTVYFQFSDNGDDWYTWQDSSGSVITLTLGNDKETFTCDDPGRYFRFFIVNTGATAYRVTAKIVGQA